MSVQAISWAFDLEDIKPGPKFVLVALCNRADENWSCYPSISYIAKETGFKQRAVQNHLNTLEEEGWIKRTRTRNTDGTHGRYRYFVQQHNVPVANNAGGEKDEEKQEPAIPASGKKRHSPPAKSAGHNRKIEPSDKDTSAREVFECLWSDVWPDIGKRRSLSKDKVFAFYQKAAKKAGSPERLNAACKRWVMDRSNGADKFAPGLHLFLRDGKWEHYLQADGVSELVTLDQWQERVRYFYKFDNWNEEWGPNPDQPGCLAPASVLEAAA